MKKLNNKILIGILVGLVLVFALAKIFRSPGLQRSLPEVLVKTDTATVSAVHLYPAAGKGLKLEFSRKVSGWTVSNGQKEASADMGSVSTMLSYLVKLAPQKLITRKKDKWQQYSVGDSSTRVVVFSGKKVLAEFHVGRTGFGQPSGPPNPYGMGGYGASFTYVRNSDEDQVYTVEGFMESAFNRGFDDWRDKSFLRLKPEQITRIRFDYPDSGFVAELKNSKWMVDGQAADSVEMKNYLNQLGFKNAQVFADDFKPVGKSDLSLTFEGSGGALATVKAWRRESDYVLNTSAQPDVYFSSASTALLSSLFERREMLSGKK
ncbi:MAG: DUF4340 domain-containing protein [Cyclobacteriaceae bacterium]